MKIFFVKAFSFIALNFDPGSEEDILGLFDSEATIFTGEVV